MRPGWGCGSGEKADGRGAGPSRAAAVGLGGWWRAAPSPRDARAKRPPPTPAAGRTGAEQPS